MSLRLQRKEVKYMTHNEDTRVKIPAILHLCRLGYDYLSLHSKPAIDEYNIFTDIFKSSIARINQTLTESDIERLLVDLESHLNNEDLGEQFYRSLVNTSGTKLIDFNNFDNNTFNVVTELPYKNKGENFRPDVILLINGMPLFFIEVKKPNNRDGIITERERINRRFQNVKFRRFVNLTQLMVFSNNMEYHDNDIEPLQGAYYATPSYSKPIFNYFREQEKLNIAKILKDVDNKLENFVIKDNNHPALKGSEEFVTNKDPHSPTNRILTSLFCRERIAFILKYGIAYVKTENGYQKHTMRYPQLFATKAIEEKLDLGWKKGIIWHTQGSGKTALAYFNVKFLTDYFKKQHIIPQFYFVVDRLDLLNQAKKEFLKRGLVVHPVNSREDFIKSIQTTTGIHNDKGLPEITVVNIQKFSNDSHVINNNYNINIKRIFFLDEVHRGYKPNGCFLANLMQADRNSIKIGLTGTPLISKKYKSRDIFGGYIHKYYYNASIADGYTLRLIREEISNDYKMVLNEQLEKLEVEKGIYDKSDVFAHPNFVEPMLDYIVRDLKMFRLANNDNSLCGMVVCDTSKQAKEMYRIFTEKHATQKEEYSLAAEPTPSYGISSNKFNITKSALILYDAGTKEERKNKIDDFTKSKIDILFVFNMLLTGFNAPNLKKLYLGRVIKDHGLLQALTRVNRTYKDYRYGYVVDFADIRKEFDKTNAEYFAELQDELGDEFTKYSNIFKSSDEITQEIDDIKDKLFNYDLTNAEIFSSQISQIDDRKKALEIKNNLESAKDLYNVIKLYGHKELLEKMDFMKIPALLKEIKERVNFINLNDAIQNGTNNKQFLNLALEDIYFNFRKTDENELVLADNLKASLRKTRLEFTYNFDKKDPEYTTLEEELLRIFKKKNLEEITQKEMQSNIGLLNKIYKRIKELNRKNDLLRQKYKDDDKFARIHKRLVEKGVLGKQKQTVYDSLIAIKQDADDMIVKNENIIDSASYFEKQMKRLVAVELMKNKIPLNPQATTDINNLVVEEYKNEYQGVYAW